MTHPLEQLQPFLEPEYWSGHMVGDGDAIPSEETTRRGTREGVEILRERLNRNPSVFPLETFRNGDRFSPDGYVPGTIALFREEGLRRQPNAPIVRMESWRNAELVERPVSLTPFVPTEENTLILAVHGVAYHSVAWWGVIKAAGPGGNTMLRMPVNNTVRFPDGRIRLIPPMLFAGDFRGKVGETRHTIHPRGEERLRRVNLLHVTAYGQRRKQERFLELFRKFAPIGSR